MVLNHLFSKLPKRIKYSEKVIYYGLKLARFFRRDKKQEFKLDYTLDYLFKSSDIEVCGTLRDIQLLYVEILRFIDNLSKKYDFDYFLAYGTLLGAVRHEGFIPWDDDCDLIMMRKDYDKLIEVLPLEINNNEFLKENMALAKIIRFKENYFKDTKFLYDKELGLDDYFYDFNRNPQWQYEDNVNLPRIPKSLFLQIGWLRPMVRLDIFPQDFIKEDSVKYYEKYYMAYKASFRNSFEEEDFKYDEEFTRRFDKLGLSLDETKFMGEGLDASAEDWLGVYDSDMFLPTKTIKFENHYFKCPNKSVELLERWYGKGYMDIPSSIAMHGYPEYNSSFFESKEEMDLSFERTIAELKKINDNFE